MAVSETFYDACGIILALVRGANIADLGCGLGAWGYIIKCKFNNQVYLVGLDIDPANLYRIKYHRVYDDLILAALPYIPFRAKSFDTILCCDVIEHLSKDNGLRLVKKAEIVVRRRVIITAPSPRIVFSSP